MDISIKNLGKKFEKEWVFRNLDLEIKHGDRWAVTGSNGSGKSTFLKIIGNYLSLSEGTITYSENVEQPQLHFSFVSPYSHLIEELTLSEFLRFHSRFKKPRMSFHEMIKAAGLDKSEDKLISDFSSGMKQRVKLMLAFHFQSRIILLDEPTSNLDEKGCVWYKSLVRTQYNEQTLVIASNQPKEYDFCEKELEIENFKN